MEPQPPPPPSSKINKNSASRLNLQINRYRNSLPQIQRGSNNYFFKQIYTNGNQSIMYTTIGYNVGTIPHYLEDLFAVAINCIHCQIDDNSENLKIIQQGDQLWVTASIMHNQQTPNNLQYNIIQAHLNESLFNTRQILHEFLEECLKIENRNDEQIINSLKAKICKDIKKVYKDPNSDD